LNLSKQPPKTIFSPVFFDFWRYFSVSPLGVSARYRSPFLLCVRVRCSHRSEVSTFAGVAVMVAVALVGVVMSEGAPFSSVGGGHHCRRSDGAPPR